MKIKSKLIVFVLTVNTLFAGITGGAAVYSDKPLLELTQWLNVASPGDTIKVSDGIYSDITININASGTEENPIIIKPSSVGGVIITGDSHISISGKYVYLSGFYFKDAKSVSNADLISIKNGEGIRITDCFFEGASGNGAGGRIISISDNSSYNRIDHCTFYDSKSIGIGIYAYDDPDGKLSNVLHNKIDNNYFKKVRAVGELYPGSVNGLECLQIGTGGISPLYTEVSYNLFEDCIGDGAEVISNKSSYNTYKFNTFLNNPSSTFCIRAGNNNTVYGNYFINMKDGVRAYGEGNILANNYFYEISRNSIVLSSVNEQSYATPKNFLIANNTIVNPYYAGISIGVKMDSVSDCVPENIRVINNHIVSEKGKTIIFESGKNVTFTNNLQRLNGYAKSDISPCYTEKYSIKKEIRIPFAKMVFRTTNSTGDSFFNGEIYVPRSEKEVKEKGIVLKELEEIDEEIKDNPFDIGIIGISDDLSKRGIITTDTCGPQDKWWLKYIDKTPSLYNKYEYNEIPVSYSPFKDEIFIEKGKEFNLFEISGYATYKTGEKFNVSRNELNFSLDEDVKIATLNKNILYPKEEGTFYIDISYRGLVKKVKVNVIPKNEYKNYSSDEDFNKFFIVTGTKAVASDKLNLNANAIALDNITVLSGNYTVSAVAKGDGAKIILGYNSNTDLSTINGYNLNNSYYYIKTGKDLSGIYKYNGISDIKIGDINSLWDEEFHNIKVNILENTITVFIDDKFSGVYKAEESISGRIGAGSELSGVVFESYETMPYTAEYKELKEASLEVSIKEENKLNISFENKVENLIYKLKRNGIWIGDFYSCDLVSDNNAHLNNTYEYELSGYDSLGNEVLRGSTEYEFSKIPDNIFYISDLYVKSGNGGTFIKGLYKVDNKGIETSKPAFSQRTYAYTYLPEELIGGQYILCDYNHRNLASAKDTTEWLKFNLNNSPCDVYILIYAKNPPDWLSQNEWQLTDMTVTAETGTDRIETAKVYKKSFTLSEGECQTVTLGGFGDGMPYGIIVKNK